MRRFHPFLMILILFSGPILAEAGESQKEEIRNGSAQTKKEDPENLIQIGLGFGFDSFRPAGAKMDSTGTTNGSILEYLADRNSPVIMARSGKASDSATFRYRIQYIHKNRFRIFLKGHAGGEPGFNRGSSFYQVGAIPGAYEATLLKGRRIYRTDNLSIQGLSWIQHISRNFSSGLSLQGEKRTLLSHSMILNGLYKRNGNNPWLLPVTSTGDMGYTLEGINPAIFFSLRWTERLGIDYSLDGIDLKGTVHSNRVEHGYQSDRYSIAITDFYPYNPYSALEFSSGSSGMKGLRHSLNLEFRLDATSSLHVGYIYENILLSHGPIDGISYMNITGESPVQFVRDQTLSYQTYRMESQEIYFLLENNIFF